MTSRLRFDAAALAACALLAGASLYMLARPDSLFALDTAHYAAWTANAPSALHTFAFALLCAACASTLGQALWLASGWAALETMAELSQILDEPAGALRWSFDGGDLVAIAIGLAAAITVLLTHRDTTR